MAFEWCCFLNKECNTEADGAIRLILYSSEPIILQIFCTLAKMVIISLNDFNDNLNDYHDIAIKSDNKSRVFS